MNTKWGLVLFLAACGRKETDRPSVPAALLEQDMARVESGLLWACDLPVEEGRKDCSGDAVSMSGRWLLDGGPDAKVWAAVKRSIGPEGRPWRAPDRVGVQPTDSFSRDQFVGLIEGTVAMGDREPLRAVWAYAQRTGALCPDATDGRCRVTPSVSILAREALGERVTDLERAGDEATLTAEAASVPGTYQAYLVARKVRVKAALGRLTPGYCHSVTVLLSRFPKNLFFRFVNAQCGKEAFEPIAEGLKACLSAWPGPGREWAWNGGNQACQAGAQGHEMVAMGRGLISSRALVGR